MNLIEVKGLTKCFGQHFAVDNVSFEIKKGEIFGLLGPNGAGKTTTIRCLLTLFKPTSGTATISGIDILTNPQQVRQICGYVPQEISVEGDLTAYENLAFYAKLFRVPGAVRRKRIEEVLDSMDLADRANDLVKTFSGGMMRRLEIGQVMVNRPQAIFLDEPSIGLDPVARRTVWTYIRRLRNEIEATILITTHDMNEADELCDRIAIMHGGKIAVVGPPQDLKASLGGDVVTIVSSSPDCPDVLKRMGFEIISQPGDGACDLVVREGDTEMLRILDGLKASSVVVKSASVKRATLDDVFLRYAGMRIEEGGNEWQNVRRSRRNLRRLTK
jgi:ABC-2 type transport system ATP-binding protein